MSEVRVLFLRFVMLAAMLFLIFGVVFGVTPMKNQDMSPRISAGDLLLYYRLGRRYENQDVVVFRKKDDKYVGRVVAKGGDTVVITGAKELKVNGSLVSEMEIFYETPPYEEGIKYPLTLEKDQYFVLGDYREGAKDSRYLGAVNGKEIKGQVITVIRRSGL